ncbi:MAG: hypothetical protein GY851_14820 [bacterium]|nr:hypothetical protein [bacterium]
MMARHGRFLEQVVAVIERSYADRPDTRVESPKMLVDRVTGEEREFDVVVTGRAGRHETVIVIECRDLARKVDVGAVEAFRAKCQDVGVAPGVMVSRKGFSKQARKKAEAAGIGCLELQEVESHPWLLTKGLDRIAVSALSQEWVFPEQDRFGSEPVEYLVDSGEPVSKERFAESGGRLLAEVLGVRPAATEEDEIKVRLSVRGLRMRGVKSGAVVDVTLALVRVVYRVACEWVPFTMGQLRDSGKDERVADVVTAPVCVGDRRGHVMIVMGEDGGRIEYVAEDEDGKGKKGEYV